MKLSRKKSAFALTFTLILMTLIAIIVVAYLSSTRIERSTSSISANRSRAQMMADSGLAAAIHLLKDNTRYGNYITAMPAPSPSPPPNPFTRWTEIYRPTDPSNAAVAKPNDFLEVSNAGGEVLASLAEATVPTGVQVDPRPTPSPIPVAVTSGWFGIPNPPFTATTSYDFNQVVRVGNNSSGRLVNSDGQPAFGQWIRLRDTSGDVIGRYAFFIEDESMKVNVDVTGNNILGSQMRVNDLASPTPFPTPATQIQELDPAAILASTANRALADTTLASLGATGDRLSSRNTLALLTEWGSVGNSFSDYAHLTTTLSRDDNTTAKGWQRLDLNALVASATDNAAKVAVATRIANWIRDAWTGPTAIADLQDYQMYGEDWLRKQIAANIVDYIDSDDTPTDMGNIIPPTFTVAIPVIGVERTAYLAGVYIIYQASDSTYPGSGDGTFTATMKLKMRFHFLNLFEPGTTLDLASGMGNTPLSRIEVKGVPIVQKNGITVYDVSSQTWTIKLSDLSPVNETGTDVPAGVDGTSTSGARTFQTDWLDTAVVSFTVNPGESSAANPKFLAQNVSVKIIGNKTGQPPDDYRLDDTSIVISSGLTNWCHSCDSSSGDFLKESNSTTRQIASINYIAGYQAATLPGGNTPGDPRYRGRLVDYRWNNDQSRTDADPSDSTNKLDSLTDLADLNPRSFGFDWFDNAGDRPLAFIRNGPMLNIGELGNIATCEYPWRSLYLQYPERPASTTSSGLAAEVSARRSNSVDYALLDLFYANSNLSRRGAININTQQRRASTQQHSLGPLFLGERVVLTGGAVSAGPQPSLTQTIVDRFCTATGNASYSPVFDRRVAVGSLPDNSPLRPFFQSGELTSMISRLVNTSVAGSGTTGSPGRSTVNYSALRNNPTATNESPINSNIHSDMQAEQEFREMSNSITTRGNVFRILYVGQAIKDANRNAVVDSPQEVQSEYLGEAFVERDSLFTPEGSNPDAMKTSDSNYKMLANHPVTE
jgi:hypothetical protein